MDTDRSLLHFNWAEALDQLIEMLERDIKGDDHDHDDHDSNSSDQTTPFTPSSFITTPLPDQQQSTPFTPSNFISTPLPEQQSTPFTPSDFISTPLPEQQSAVPFTPSNFMTSTPLPEQQSTPFTPSNFISTPSPEQQWAVPFTPSNFLTSTPLPEQQWAPFTPSDFTSRTPLPEQPPSTFSPSSFSNAQQQPAPFTPSNFITTPLNKRHGKNPAPSEVENGAFLISELVDDKLLRALVLSKECYGEGSLAQMWLPVKMGEKIQLSTCKHLFILQDETLSGYRLVSRLFSFPADPRGRSVSDLPTRVFASKLPEWTSKVSYYNNEEFLRTHLAAENKVCGTLAIPVFEDDAQASCCAVFELVTAQERPNFNAEMDVMCKALQAVELSSSRPLRLDSQSLSLLQNAAVSEIKGILHAICHAHSLPLALTWVPRDYLESSGGREVDFDVDGNIDANRKSLWADETACYWKDTNMEGFIHACTTHPLKQGLGLVGKSLQSDKALFHLDVKKLHINEYPLVHHARRFGLGAAIAIRIRSAYTGPDDYVMEFFLPVDMKEAKEQESMLDSIASTIVSINRSLTKKPNIQLLEEKDFKFEFVSCDREDIPPASASATTSDDSAIDDMVDDIPEVAAMDDGDNNIIVIEDDDPPKEAAVAPVQRAKRKVANDRGITVQQLEPYYSGSMAHAARCLGVAPNTIKRVCRLNGISRWPSRKLNKVDRSLKKIQKEMESVEGVPGGLVFDPPTGRLLAAGSMIQLNPSDAFSFDVPAAANTTTTAPERQPDRKNKAPVTSTSTSDEWIKYLMSDG